MTDKETILTLAREVRELRRALGCYDMDNHEDSGCTSGCWVTERGWDVADKALSAPSIAEGILSEES